MVKKIKFPFEMGEGVQVRSIEELREHFNLEKVIGYLLDGKLLTWLDDRYYDNEVKKISQLDNNSQKLNASICEILGVEYHQDEENDIKKIKKRNEKIAKLKQVSDNPTYIKDVESIAFDQEDLEELIDEEINPIYLYGDSFLILSNRCNMQYIGINNPTVEFESIDAVDLNKNNIVITGVKWNDSSVFNAEQLFLQYKIKEAVKVLTDIAECNNTRAMYILSRILDDGCGGIEKNNRKALELRKKGYEAGDTLCSIQFGLFHYSDKDMKIRILHEYKPKLVNMADNGDVFAQYELGICYINETDEPIEYSKALTWLHKSADKGYWRAYDSIARRYAKGEGVEQNYSVAAEWFLKAAEMGYYKSMFELGKCYKLGLGVEKDNEKASYWFKRFSEQISRNEKILKIDNFLSFINNISKEKLYGFPDTESYSIVDATKSFSTRSAAKNYAENQISYYIDKLEDFFNLDNNYIRYFINKYYTIMDNAYSKLEELYIILEGDNQNISEEHEHIEQSIFDKMSDMLSFGDYNVYDINKYYDELELRETGGVGLMNRKYRADFTNNHLDKKFERRKEEVSNNMFNYISNLIEFIVEKLNEKRDNL